MCVAVTYASYAFVKNQFHYLDAPSIEMFMVTDVFDCTFECLRLPSCVSVNVASNKEAPGNIFCELLSSDKYQKSQKFTGNKTSHHLFKKVKVSEKTSWKKPNLNNACMRIYQCVTQKKILLIVKISTETTAFKTNRLTKQIKSEPTI